ncbi:MAG: 50S ribosomal protein L10 [Pseudomonadales bacterium]|nr:50S ribosomal protein L10 [Pseudomonadales bacterium]
MALDLEGKKVIVAEVTEAVSSALSAVIADYRGTDVSALTSLRSQAREQGVYVRVVRNSLAKRAIVGTEFECMSEAFVGPTLLALSLDSPGAAARLLKDFAKANDTFEVRALAIGGELMGPEKLDAVAKLPTRDEAISILMGTMLAPVSKLVSTMNEVPSKFVRVVAAVKDQKQEAA